VGVNLTSGSPPYNPPASGWIRKNTTILAIDTATGPCSVALWDGKRISAYLENTKPVMQSASLMPMVEEALKQSGMGYEDVSAVAATVGPGSFTGIRVGLAAAQGIAFAAGIKSMGFTTLEVLAFAARKHAGNILAILNAGKGEWYYQHYASGKPLEDAQLGPLEQALAIAGANAVIAGNVILNEREGSGARSFAALRMTDVTFPRADALAELAATSSAAQPLRPFYIRPPDAKLPEKKNI
jgi:tRNA threonylcarbamoyladenosine biosynthesis protein TsaB